VQVAGEFRLGEDTLALTVNFFDRLLSAVVVPSPQLQTASLACLFVAAKLLERRPLSMRQIKKYFAEIASCDDVRMAELNILFYLRWDTNAFTALDFIRTALELVPDAELRSEIQKRAEAVHRAAMLGEWLVGACGTRAGVRACSVCVVRGRAVVCGGTEAFQNGI